MEPSRDYQLPKRFLTPHSEGGAANVEMPFDDMMNEYYSVRDWPNGVPSQGKLKELDLDFCL